MENPVQAILLGIVIISAIGSILGYLLEPGRFAKRDATEVPAADLSGVQAQASDGSPRLAA